MRISTNKYTHLRNSKLCFFVFLAMLALPAYAAANTPPEKKQSASEIAHELADTRRKTFRQLGEIFSPFISVSALDQEKAGLMSRRRLFTKENTFWSFLGQIF